MDYLMHWELTTHEIIYKNDETRNIDVGYLDAYRLMSSEQPHSESVDQWIRRNYLLHIP